MTARFAGRHVLVTGAARGIGAAIVDRFAAEGAITVAVDRDPVDRGSHAIRCDVTDDSAMAAMIDTVTAVASPDIVVHAAAISANAALVATPPDAWRALFAVNLFAAAQLLQAFAPAMQARGGGSFVMLSSVNAAFATPGQGAYAASKAALDSLVKTAAQELAPGGVRINSVRPASVDTPLLRAGIDVQADPPAALARNIARHPLGRIGTPDEVAELVLFLASDAAAWITGAHVAIDGGAGVTRG